MFNIDKNFTPIICVLNDYKNRVNLQKNKRLKICVERNNGYNYVYTLNIFSDETGQNGAQNYEIVEKIISAILWIAGGYKIYLCGSDYLFKRIKQDYSFGGKRFFDGSFMSSIYKKPFEVINCQNQGFPPLKNQKIALQNSTFGDKIGLDVGGSDVKVCAVSGDNVVFCEEKVWFPKQNPDINYHYNFLKSVVKRAVSKVKNAKRLCVSTAGVCIDNLLLASQIYQKVPKDQFEQKGKQIYQNIAKEFGLSLSLFNDGSICALDGENASNQSCTLGISMGTSLAGGYVEEGGFLNGWLMELAFVPINFNCAFNVEKGANNLGCGGKYLSQEGVINLAKKCGIGLKNGHTSAQKLQFIQNLANKKEKSAQKVFKDFGVYLGYAIAYYNELFKFERVKLFGRVLSGTGGEIILKSANKILSQKFCNLLNVKIELPSENEKRFGQCLLVSKF